MADIPSGHDRFSQNTFARTCSSTFCKAVRTVPCPSSAEDNCVEEVAGGGYIVCWRSWRATADEDGHYCFAVAL
jgi:hypothetical protein